MYELSTAECQPRHKKPNLTLILSGDISHPLLALTVGKSLALRFGNAKENRVKQEFLD